ncbi:MAG TPA: bifunctional YncE family protein/alkaline phosphatase family protein, partial [Candidatus Kapabacteria bacterium]|nr:bifunctional YncE family protein/alkaline phosphatase family protein [Candidatus Kapabacteria bacterium]
NIAISKSKKLLAVTNNGQSDQSIQLIDAVKQVVIDSVKIGKSWLGLAFSNDDKSLYASGGNDNWIVRYDIIERKLIAKDTIVLGKPWPEIISPAGIAIDDEHNILYAVAKESGSLYVVDLAAKDHISHYDLGGEGYTCLLSPDNATLYISCWGCDKVQLFDTKQKTFSGAIAVGDNPNDMCLTKNGKFLYVANSNDNSVSVIDLAQRKVIETLNAALYPNAPSGSTTNSVALSTNEKTLYVANADNNCLAVFDVSKPGKSSSKGYIPTGWYPTCVRVVGTTIYVTNGKGFSSKANPKGPNPRSKKQEVQYQHSGDQQKEKVQYIGGLFRGTMSIIPTPNDRQMSIYSRVVYHNTPYSKDIESSPEGMAGNPIPQKLGDASPIKYVFYVIKENRTYDQVLGDVKAGNGDTSLVLFGEPVTPNEHSLVNEFVLLDNFYVDGEVSADGHNWSTGAYATDFLEKNWPTTYGGRGGFYNAEGSRDIANNKNGFIWDFCKRYGVSYRTYGEFIDDNTPSIPALNDHFCRTFKSWDEATKDTTRFYQWQRDFDSLLAADQLPHLNTVRFINDHTEGLKLGKFTPAAHVADNDLAVGLFVEYLSHSKIWNECAVFIVEDDAQNGPDHVDAHRSTVYLAGGRVKRHFVDHTVYSTSSVLRTMELILGLPPMSQYDAAATPMWRCFSDKPDMTPFKSIPTRIDINEKNTAMNEWQRKSEQFDFGAEDRVPEAAFNEVLWYAVKGESICPAPVHAAFFTATKNDEDDD